MIIKIDTWNWLNKKKYYIILELLSKNKYFSIYIKHKKIIDELK
jgi:short-subunit dehydrogenase